MIRLFRPTRPIELTEKKIEEFTKKYIETGNAVWKKAFIIKPLLQMTHNKCAYCECKLDIQGKSVTIDHFHCKSLYPEEVVSWNNLLPSCVHCNTNKGKIDTKEYHIIDPSKDNPKDYLYLSHYMIRSKDNSLTSKGRRTVDELQLNHRERLVWARIEIADNLIRKLEEIHEKAEKLIECNNSNVPGISRVTQGITDLLYMVQPEAEYSAFMAAIILDNPDFIETIEILKKLKLWTDKQNALYKEGCKIKFDTSY